MITPPSGEVMDAFRNRHVTMPPHLDEGGTGHGIPSGGTRGQLLQKKTNTDYDVEWSDVPQELPEGGTTGQVLAKKTDTSGDVEWVDQTGGSLPSGGTAGQVLTKTASGEEWADVPDELPSGGTTGQVLTKTASGVDWETPSGGGSVPDPTASGKILKSGYRAAEPHYYPYWANDDKGAQLRQIIAHPYEDPFEDDDSISIDVHPSFYFDLDVEYGDYSQVATLLGRHIADSVPDWLPGLMVNNVSQCLARVKSLLCRHTMEVDVTTSGMFDPQVKMWEAIVIKVMHQENPDYKSPDGDDTEIGQIVYDPMAEGRSTLRKTLMSGSTQVEIYLPEVNYTLNPWDTAYYMEQWVEANRSECYLLIETYLCCEFLTDDGNRTVTLSGTMTDHYLSYGEMYFNLVSNQIVI